MGPSQRAALFFEQYSHEPYIAVNRHWRLHLPLAEQSRLADRIAHNHTRGEHALAVMEQRLRNSAWLATGCYTVADIALYAYTHTARDGGFELAPYSGIRAWLKRVRAQPGHIPQMQEEQGVPSSGGVAKAVTAWTLRLPGPPTQFPLP